MLDEVNSIQVGSSGQEVALVYTRGGKVKKPYLLPMQRRQAQDLVPDR